MSAPIETDVLVIGGGVAGAATARLLAEAGHRVIVLDRAHFPRDKPCGEGVMPTGVRLLDQLGVLANIPPGQSHTLRGVSFVVNGRDRLQGDFPDAGGGFDRGLGVKRLVLDHHLLKHARSHPRVEVHEGEPVTKMEWPPGGLAEIATPSGNYRARVVVGADGARSLVRRRLGLELPRGRRRRYAMRAHFSFPDGRALGDYVTVYSDHGAECYTTPVSDTELEVALLVERSGMAFFAGRHEEAFDTYLQSLPPPPRRHPGRATFVGGAGVWSVRCLGQVARRRSRDPRRRCGRLSGSDHRRRNRVGLAERLLGRRGGR